MSGLNAVASVWNHLVSVCVTFGLLKFLFGFPLCSGRTCRDLGSFGNPCLSKTQDCNNEKLVCLYDEFNENWVFLGSASVKVIWTSLSPNCDPSGLAFVSSWNGCNAPLGWQTERRTQKPDNSRGKVNDCGERVSDDCFAPHKVQAGTQSQGSFPALCLSENTQACMEMEMLNSCCSTDAHRTV